MVPYVIFGLPAGVVGDRHRRRKVMWISYAAQMIAALIIPLWAAAEAPPLLIVLAVAFAIGAGRVFVDAAVFGAIAAIIGRERFTEGQATLSAAWAIGFLAGPAIGGVLIGLIGPAFTLVVEAFGFGLALVLVLLIRTPLDAATPASSVPAVAMMREGLAVIWRTPRVRAYTWVSVAWNLAAAASLALVVPLLRETLELSSTKAGIVLAVGALMGMGVPSLLVRVVPRFGAGRVTAWTTLGSAAGILASGFAPGFVTVTAANALRSLGDYSLLSTIIGERQRGVPDRLQARVGISGRMIAVAAISSGAVVGSVLSDLIGVRGVFIASGIAVGIAFALTVPAVLRLDRDET